MARHEFGEISQRFLVREWAGVSLRFACSVASLGFASLCSVALAQGIDSGALMRRQQQNAPTEQPGAKTSSTPKLEVKKPAAETQQVATGGKTFVKRFKLATPSTLLNEERLNTVLSSFLERDCTIEDLRKASDQVSNYLRERGYAFASAFLPKQEIVDGMVTIDIAQGRLSTEADGQPSISLKTNGKIRLDQERAKAIMGAAVSDPEGLNIRQLERGLLLLNDLPGIQGSGVVVPGKEPGTAGLTIEVREGPLIEGWLGFDNFGSRSTGTARGIASARLNNPSGRGDLAELNLIKSSGTESATASYLLPVGVTGLRARLAASGLQYRVEDSVSVTDAEGGSVWLSAGLSYPWLRTQAASTYLTGTMDFKQFKDSLAGVQTSSRQTRSLSLGSQGNYYFAANGRSLNYSATLTGGNVDRGAVPSDLAADEVTRNTQGGYGILRVTGSWIEQLGTDFSASATLAMQFSSKNLDSSEKIYLGGPRGVRAYPIEEAGSDGGQILNLEARWRAVNTRERGGWDWTLFAFFDVGRAVINNKIWDGWNTGNPGLRNEYTLMGWGLGTRLQVAQRVQIEVVGATKIGENPGRSARGLDADGRSDQSRVWLYGTLFF